MWATSIQLFAYIQCNVLCKKKKKKKNGCRTKKNGAFLFLMVVAHCVWHFWKMFVARWLWAFWKNLRLFDKHYGRPGIPSIVSTTDKFWSSSVKVFYTVSGSRLCSCLIPNAWNGLYIHRLVGCFRDAQPSWQIVSRFTDCKTDRFVSSLLLTTHIKHHFKEFQTLSR